MRTDPTVDFVTLLSRQKYLPSISPVDFVPGWDYSLVREEDGGFGESGEVTLDAILYYDRARQLFVDAYLHWDRRYIHALDWRSSSVQASSEHLKFRETVRHFFSSVLNALGLEESTRPTDAKDKRRWDAVSSLITHATEMGTFAQTKELVNSAAARIEVTGRDRCPDVFLEYCQEGLYRHVFLYAISSYMTLPPLCGNGRGNPGKNPNYEPHPLFASIAEAASKLPDALLEGVDKDVLKSLILSLPNTHSMDLRFPWRISPGVASTDPACSEGFKPLRLDSVVETEGYLRRKYAGTPVLSAFLLAKAVARVYLDPFKLFRESGTVLPSKRLFVEQWHRAIDSEFGSKDDTRKRTVIFSELLETKTEDEINPQCDHAARNVWKFVGLLTTASSKEKSRAPEARGSRKRKQSHLQSVGSTPRQGVSSDVFVDDDDTDRTTLAPSQSWTLKQADDWDPNLTEYAPLFCVLERGLGNDICGRKFNSKCKCGWRPAEQ